MAKSGSETSIIGNQVRATSRRNISLFCSSCEPSRIALSVRTCLLQRLEDGRATCASQSHSEISVFLRIFLGPTWKRLDRSSYLERQNQPRAYESRQGIECFRDMET